MLNTAVIPEVLGQLFRFSDWPNPSVPKVAAGVYTIWEGHRFIYVGMAGRGLTVEQLCQRRNGKGCTGLFDRLGSHASGRRSGDQFCVYVSDRLVLRTLTTDQIQAISEGKLKLDALVRHYIHTHLAYRYVETPDGGSAEQLERVIRREGLTVGRPFLNP